MAEEATAVSASSTGGEATSTGSAPVNQTPVTTDQVSAEQPLQQEGDVTQQADTTGEGTEGAEQEVQTVPYDRFKEVNDQLREAKQAQAVLNKLREDPSLANELLGLAGKPVQQDPVMDRATETIKQINQKLGVMTREEYQAEQQQAEAIKEFRGVMQDMEKKYDGSDGMPKFEAIKVAEYMDTKGISDPDAAYKSMHFDAIVDAIAKKQAKGTPYSEKPGVGRATAGRDDYQASIEEAKKTGLWSQLLENFVPDSVKGQGS